MADVLTIPQEEQQSLWSAVKESIRGSHRDYTRGPIGRAILLLAIPMVVLYFAAAGVAWWHDRGVAKREAALEAEIA